MSTFRRIVVAAILMTSSLPVWAQTGGKYTSHLWHFCLTYPADWKGTELYAGKAFKLAPVDFPQHALGPSIVASGFRQMERHGGDFPGENRPRPLGPRDMLDEAIGALQDHMVRNLQVSSREETLWGMDALVSDISYDQEGVHWRSKQIRAMRPDNTVLELVMSSPEAQYQAAMNAFKLIIQGFHPSCAGPAAYKGFKQPGEQPANP